MSRPHRSCPAGFVFHVLNRAIARARIFADPDDFSAFESLLAAAVARVRTRLLAYCVMSNHWHLVIWARTDRDVSAFAHWLSHRHARAFHEKRGTTGSGHVYQGRFKSFPVQTDAHFFRLCAYVEGNPIRAGLVSRAEEWPAGSARRRDGRDARLSAMLHEWPLERPPEWREFVNHLLSPADLEEIRNSVRRGRPLGAEAWRKEVTSRLGLEATSRGPGRPRKPPVP